jgi:hypothetical protein
LPDSVETWVVIAEMYDEAVHNFGSGKIPQRSGLQARSAVKAEQIDVVFSSR